MLMVLYCEKFDDIHVLNSFDIASQCNGHIADVIPSSNTCKTK